MRKVDISKKEMIAHLESFKPTSRVGACGNPQDCVVARMVKKIYKVDDAFVSESHIDYERVGGKPSSSSSYTNPMWLTKFINAMDNLTTKYTTAEQALTFFKK